MKVITHPVTGKTYKLGRTRPTAPHCRGSFKHMMKAGVLPNVTVPANTNYSGKAATSLHNILMNDTLGDCVIAGGFHVRGITSFNSGVGKVFSQADVIHDYGAIGGYNPNAPLNPDGSNPTDNGCDENTALAYWQKTGFADGVKLVNSIAVDATNVEEVRLALYLFENIYFGVELPDAWVNPMPAAAGFRWDMAGLPNPDQGHCFIGCDLVPKGVKICTWGMCGYVTDAAVAYYCAPAQGGQLFTLLSPDIISRVSAKSPAGYDVTALTNYLAQL